MSLELPNGIMGLLEDDARGVIKLNDFSKIFFPMFLAYFKQEENVELGRWLTFTKTRGYEWVDVVQGGEVIFSVPPILQSRTLAAGKGLKQDPGDIMHIAKIKDRTMPGAGNQHVRENLTQALDLSEDYIAGQDDFRDKWLPIFEYYGYTLGKGSGGSTSSSDWDYSAGDDEEYDEL